MKNRNYIFDLIILYLNYFIHGIGAAILAQQVIKNSLAMRLNTSDSKIIYLAAALGLGRLISLPISGPLSDKYGRKLSSVIGIFCYLLFFVGLFFVNSMTIAYIIAILGGIANSFLDTGVIPACVEILKDKSGFASILTKFFMSIGQILLPFMVILTLKYLPDINYLLLIFALFCLLNLLMIQKVEFKDQKVRRDESVKIKLNKISFMLITIGFTATASFQIWLNICQKLAVEYNLLTDASILQTFYSTGSILAVIITSFLVLRIKEIYFLIIYPLCALVSMILILFESSEFTIKLVSFLVGFFAAGGVLQMATAVSNDLFKENKGKITGIIMIASSLSNYFILNVAGFMSDKYGSMSVVILDIIITFIGFILAILIFVNTRKKITQ